MRPALLRCIGGLVCALALAETSVSLFAEDPTAVVIPAAVQQAVADLSASEFTQRQAAEQRLIALGPPAFEPLVALLDKAPPDAGQRLLLILEQIWLQAPEPQADSLERQLETLRLTWGPYQPAAARLLLAHHRLREQRAVRALRRLNAVVETDEDEDELEIQILQGQPIPNEMPKRIVQIILPRSWKGTEADLWHIQRLSHLESLSVFVIVGNGISESAKQRMHLGFPSLSITDRAEVFIGVMGSPFESLPGCHVASIQPGSPAEIAGLRNGDLIQKVDGHPIRNFAGLIDALKAKRAYQPIELTVNRGLGYAPRNGESPPLEGESPQAKPLTLTLIGHPWEVRGLRIPPPPPVTELLIPGRPSPESPRLP